MFKNLLFEFEKHNIRLNDAAAFLKISPYSLKQKLNGEKSFKILECLKLQKLIGDGNLCLEYLFKK